jgi:hypothetical protein
VGASGTVSSSRAGSSDAPGLVVAVADQALVHAAGRLERSPISALAQPRRPHRFLKG